MSPDRLRVVQWATGNIGRRALREVIRDPSLELVAVLVYDPDKEGVDAGRLCGEDPVGVAATTDRDAIHAVAADCALYMPQRLDLDDVVRLLESGTNVVTTVGELFDRGRPLGSEGQARVVGACRRGASSIYATGSSPGFITEVLPFALLSLQRQVELLEIDEFANLSRRDSPTLLFELMGFGQPPESVDDQRATFLQGAFAPSLGRLADAAGRPVSEWTASTEVAAARHDTTILAGELRAGTVGAQRNTIIGRSGGTDVVCLRTNWYCTLEVEPAWELRPTGWRVQVHGDAPLDVALPFPIALEALDQFTPAYTANRPVNAIRYVWAAAPGILATDDLPPITPAGPRAT